MSDGESWGEEVRACVGGGEGGGHEVEEVHPVEEGVQHGDDGALAAVGGGEQEEHGEYGEHCKSGRGISLLLSGTIWALATHRGWLLPLLKRTLAGGKGQCHQVPRSLPNKATTVSLPRATVRFPKKTTQVFLG